MVLAFIMCVCTVVRGPEVSYMCFTTPVFLSNFLILLLMLKKSVAQVYISPLLLLLLLQTSVWRPADVYTG